MSDVLVQYLREARATETGLAQTLQVHIAATPPGDHRARLEQHLEETRAHEGKLASRIDELDEDGDPLRQALDLVSGPVGYGLGLASLRKCFGARTLTRHNPPCLKRTRPRTQGGLAGKLGLGKRTQQAQRDVQAKLEAVRQGHFAEMEEAQRNHFREMRAVEEARADLADETNLNARLILERLFLRLTALASQA